MVVVAAVGRGEDAAEESLEVGRALQLIAQRPSRQDVVDDDVEVVEELGPGGGRGGGVVISGLVTLAGHLRLLKSVRAFNYRCSRKRLNFPPKKLICYRFRET